MRNLQVTTYKMQSFQKSWMQQHIQSPRMALTTCIIVNAIFRSQARSMVQESVLVSEGVSLLPSLSLPSNRSIIQWSRQRCTASSSSVCDNCRGITASAGDNRAHNLLALSGTGSLLAIEDEWRLPELPHQGHKVVPEFAEALFPSHGVFHADRRAGHQIRQIHTYHRVQMSGRYDSCGVCMWGGGGRIICPPSNRGPPPAAKAAEPA
jgi:hypothetical protein